MHWLALRRIRQTDMSRILVPEKRSEEINGGRDYQFSPFSSAFLRARRLDTADIVRDAIFR